MRPLIHVSIGNGRSFLVWYDSWLVGGPILQQFSSGIILDANSSLNAKVDDFLCLDGIWNWPSTFMDMIDLTSQVHLINAKIKREDCVICLPCQFDVFLVASAQESLHPKHPVVSLVLR